MQLTSPAHYRFGLLETAYVHKATEIAKLCSRLTGILRMDFALVKSARVGTGTLASGRSVQDPRFLQREITFLLASQYVGRDEAA